MRASAGIGPCRMLLWSGLVVSVHLANGDLQIRGYRCIGCCTRPLASRLNASGCLARGILLVAICGRTAWCVSSARPGGPWSIQVKSWLWCGTASRRPRRANSCERTPVQLRGVRPAPVVGSMPRPTPLIIRPVAGGGAVAGGLCAPGEGRSARLRSARCVPAAALGRCTRWPLLGSASLASCP
jgi:hypothetical protein